MGPRPRHRHRRRRSRRREHPASHRQPQSQRPHHPDQRRLRRHPPAAAGVGQPAAQARARPAGHLGRDRATAAARDRHRQRRRAQGLLVCVLLRRRRLRHRVSFSPVIDIHLTEPLDINTLRDQWLQPLPRIIGLSTGPTETITYLGVELAGGEDRELQVYGTNIIQQPYAPRGNDLLKITRAFHSYQDGDTGLLKLCRGWQTAQAERHPLVETLGTFLSLSPQHPRARFLLLVQALEGLHGHENAAAFNRRLARHQADRDRARAALQACEGLDREVRRFIRATLPKWPASSLDRALQDVVTQLPVDLTTKLADLELVTSLIAADDQVTDWTSALRIVRNGLSHGRRNWPPDMLEPAAELLEVIARAHLMRVIGVATASIRTYLERAATTT